MRRNSNNNYDGGGGGDGIGSGGNEFNNGSDKVNFTLYLKYCILFLVNGF